MQQEKISLLKKVGKSKVKSVTVFFNLSTTPLKRVGK
jgi:hypothetical protein